MNCIVFDIETGPLPIERLQEILPPFDPNTVPHPGSFDPRSVKCGNLKDQTKIDAKIDEARAQHEESVRNYDSDLVAAEFMYWQEHKNKAALSAMTGRVIAIGTKCCDSLQLDCINDSTNEEIIIRSFWHMYLSIQNDKWNLVGFNSDDFDIPFLCQRSVILGIKIPDSLIQNRRFINSTFIDLRKLWGFGKLNPSGSLDAVCRACGIGRKPDGINGSQFSDLYFNPETRTVALAYLTNDLEMTFALAQRLIGDGSRGSSSLESSFLEFVAKER